MSSESWESQTHQYSWIAEYYKKEEILRNFLVLCKEESCQKIYRYVKYPWQFRKHMREMHRYIYNYEGLDIEHEIWKYCRITKNKYFICIFCNIKLSDLSPNDTLLKHVTFVHHQEDLEFYEKQDWIWKYLIPVEDFSGKCYLCEDEAYIVELDLNVLNLKKHILEEHKKECQISLSTLNKNWEYAAEKYNWLEKCYINLGVDFLVQCILCTEKKNSFQSIFFDTSFFEKHIYEKHISVYISEMTPNQFISDYWSYFRYTKSEIQEEIQCILCDKILQNLNSTQKKNMKMIDHVEKYEALYSLRKQNWSLKYINEDEDSAICVICEESLPYCLDISYLKRHMNNMHKENWEKIQKESKQGVHAQAEP